MGPSPGFDDAPILLIQDISTAVLRTTIAGIVCIIPGIISVVVDEFLPLLNIPYCDNPERVVRFFDLTVRITGMVNKACRILQRLTVNRVAVIHMKDVGVTGC